MISHINYYERSIVDVEDYVNKNEMQFSISYKIQLVLLANY